MRLGPLTVRRLAKGLFGISFGTGGAGTWESSQAWARGNDLPRNALTLTDPYANHATVAVAISIVAGDAASVEWELYPEGEDETPVESHPLLDLLKRPAPRMSGYQLWVGTYVSWLLWGEAFWYYDDLQLGIADGARASRRSTGGIQVLDPRMVELSLKDGVMKASWRSNGQDVPLDVDKLTHFKRHNPYSVLRGLSPLQAALMDAQGDYAASAWNSSNFTERNGVPGGLLIPNKEAIFNPAEREDFVNRWNNKHVAMRRNVGILPAGWDWKDLGVTQKDMDFRGLREYSREQILAVYGVPPFYAGVLENANYANAREQKEVYWLGTIQRFLSSIQATLNSDFLPKVGITGLEFFPNWEAVKSLIENFGEKVDAARDLFAMGFTRRQLNDRLELGFDVGGMADADTSYLPFSVMPADMLAESRTLAGPTDDEPSDDEDPSRRATRSAALDPEAVERRRAMVWRSIAFRTRDLEARMDRLLRAHFQEIQAEVLGKLDSVRGWLLSYGHTTKAELDDVISDLFDLARAKAKLRRLAAPLQEQGLVRGAESIFAELGVSIDWSIDDPVAAAMLAQLQFKITRIDETVERLLRDSLGDGLAAGESPQEMAKRVREVMDASKSRSMTIARTEMGQAFSSGRFEGMKAAGIEKHQWLSARLDNVRDDHKAEDGTVVATNALFPTTGLRYPLDPNGPAEQIINCRCAAIPVVE